MLEMGGNSVQGAGSKAMWAGSIRRRNNVTVRGADVARAVLSARNVVCYIATTFDREYLSAVAGRMLSLEAGVLFQKPAQTLRTPLPEEGKEALTV